MVGVGMGEKHIFHSANITAFKLRERVIRSSHFPAVHQKSIFARIYIKAISAVFTNTARDFQLLIFRAGQYFQRFAVRFTANCRTTAYCQRNSQNGDHCKELFYDCHSDAPLNYKIIIRFNFILYQITNWCYRANDKFL